MVMNVKEHILAAIRKCLAKNLPASGKAILFGSQARGTAREDSDWDILIILDKEPDGLDFFTFYLKKSSFFAYFSDIIWCFQRKSVLLWEIFN